MGAYIHVLYQSYPMSATIPTVTVSPPVPPPTRKRFYDSSPEPSENGTKTRDKADSPGGAIIDSPGDTVADESDEGLLSVLEPDTDTCGKAKRRKQVHDSQVEAFEYEVQLAKDQEQPPSYV
jgi:hypothetical protein